MLQMFPAKFYKLRCILFKKNVILRCILCIHKYSLQYTFMKLLIT